MFWLRGLRPRWRHVSPFFPVTETESMESLHQIEGVGSKVFITCISFPIGRMNLAESKFVTHERVAMIELDIASEYSRETSQ